MIILAVAGLWTAEEFRKNIADFVAWTFSQTSPELKIIMLRNIRHCLHTFTAKSLTDILGEVSQIQPKFALLLASDVVPFFCAPRIN
jgi:hypothetical protein